MPENFRDVPLSGNRGLLSYTIKSKQIEDHTNKCYFMHEIFGEPTKYSTYDKPFIIYEKRYKKIHSPSGNPEPFNDIFAKIPNNEESPEEVDFKEIKPPVILKPKDKTMFGNYKGYLMPQPDSQTMWGHLQGLLRQGGFDSNDSLFNKN
mgnify:CR=1 FL=1